MLWLRELLSSLNLTELILAILGSLGAVAVWFRRQYKKYRDTKIAREKKRAAFEQLPNRVTDLFALVADVSAKSVQALDVLDAHTKILDDQTRVLGGISAMVHGEMELDPTPRFICDDEGRNLNVNTAYARLIGCGRDELLGFGYQRFVSTDLNPTYLAEFEKATEQHRSFDYHVRLRRSDGVIITANVRIVPHPENEPPAHYWVGVIVATATSTWTSG